MINKNGLSACSGILNKTTLNRLIKTGNDYGK
jgi:hypothetical protein